MQEFLIVDLEFYLSRTNDLKRWNVKKCVFMSSDFSKKIKLIEVMFFHNLLKLKIFFFSILLRENDANNA